MPTDCHGATGGGSLSPFNGPATYVSGTIVCAGSCAHSGDEYVEKDCSSHGSPCKLQQESPLNLIDIIILFSAQRSWQSKSITFATLDIAN